MPDLYWKPGDPLDGPERWAPVVGYEGIYEVSTHGRVRRIVAGPGTRPGTANGRVLKPFLGAGKSGLYPQVSLCWKGKQKTCRVHCVVAAAFLGQAPQDSKSGPEFMEQVHHIDDNPQNNRAENLEYTSQYENLMEQQARFYRTGRAE